MSFSLRSWLSTCAFNFWVSSRFISHPKLHFAVVRMLFLSLFLRLLLLIVLIIWCDAFAAALAQLQGEMPIRLQLPNSAKRFSFWVPFFFLRGGYAACPPMCFLCSSGAIWHKSHCWAWMWCITVWPSALTPVQPLIPSMTSGCSSTQGYFNAA